MLRPLHVLPTLLLAFATSVVAPDSAVARSLTAEETPHRDPMHHAMDLPDVQDASRTGSRSARRAEARGIERAA